MNYKKIILMGILFHIGITNYAQNIPQDSLFDDTTLNEIIINQTAQSLHQKQTKPLATLEEFLDASSKINMIKRGGYAWEPLINGMATERTVITIDGMRIFGACTDKMDPITSYVETTNLSKASVISGQQGAGHGSTIGGTLELKRYSIKEEENGFKGRLLSGYETNNQQKIVGGSLGFKNPKLYAQTDFTYRDAENYKAGKDKEVYYSQFTKYNVSGTLGYLLNEHDAVEASIIFDKATNVGYPALPMDVSLAKALISSVKYEKKHLSNSFKNWETKLYYNTVTHIMDDTKRKNVPIHMDMPGKTDTYGLYSKISGTFQKHHFSTKLNTFYNRSIAEMTMYPNNPNEKLMFMYTWPDVRTFYSGLFLEDHLELNEKSSFKFTGNVAYHSNEVADDFGLSSLQIFYPEMKTNKNRLLKSFSANYLNQQQNWKFDFGIGYGERAPSVSEGYGFYLYNSNDFYDYVGNPNLANEKSWEFNTSIQYFKKSFRTRFSASYFHILDYIVGKKDPSTLPMTIGAAGIKRYTALDFANMFHTDLDMEYFFLKNFKVNTQFSYNYGKGNDGNYLPFISPFQYKLGLHYSKDRFIATFLANGNSKHSSNAAFYGENQTASYIVFGLHTGYSFEFDKTSLNLHAGIDNIFDSYYTTFADWNNIPRIGRNIFLNVEWKF
ncbi:MAG TPA: TonB-dependent receptor [Flavobacterium sp.]|nr:TonB-dependent receptor [Flavobacterium sp.]